MEGLTRQRGGIRGAVTRIIQKLDAAIKAGTEPGAVSTGVEIEANLSRLVQKEAELLALNKEIEKGVSDSDLDEERAGAEDYEDRIAIAKVKASRALPQEAGVVPSVGIQATATSTKKAVRVTLPKIELRKFSGDVTQWQAFWDRFKASVDSNNELAAVDKLTYLVSVLEGQAAAVVSGLSITAANYPVALQLLKERFGREDLVIDSHMRQLLDLRPITLNSGNPAIELRKLHDICAAKIRSLEALGVTSAEYERMLKPALVRLLSSDLQREWNRRVKLKQATNDLQGLLSFIQGEVESNERLVEYQANTGKDSKVQNRKESEGKSYKPPSTSSLIVGSKGPKESGCAFCGATTHNTVSCKVVVQPELRRSKVRELKLCYSCLNSGHISSSCERNNGPCSRCGGRHHLSLCLKREESSKTVSTSVIGQHKKDAKERAPNTNLQTALIWIEGKEGWTKIRCLIDGGSERSFVEEKLVNELGNEVTGVECLQVYAFGQEKASVTRHKKVVVRVTGLYGGPVIELPVVETSRITAASVSTPSAEQLKRMKQLGLCPADVESPKRVELLIGGDNYWRIVLGQIHRFSDTFVAVESIFGWMLHGVDNLQETNSKQADSVQVFHAVVTSTQEENSERQLCRLWEMDAGALEQHAAGRSWSREEKQVHENFKRSLRFEDGRYVVRLPWKEEVVNLDDNWDVARKRLKLLIHRLQKDQSLWQRYDTAINEYLICGHAEEVDESIPPHKPTYYLPHHAVIREDRTTTKLRVVFDGSSKGSSSISLNDSLETGPNMNPEIMAMLIRFRSHKIAFTADIEKAFLQVALADEDRDATRFMWIRPIEEVNGSNNVLTLRMTRVLFGAKSSPYLLAATIRHHAQKFKEQFPQASEMLDRSTYVDDLASGDDSDEAALDRYKEVKEIAETANMKLKKWVSNSKTLRDFWETTGESQHPFKEISNEEGKAEMKILGLRWEPEDDVFTFTKDWPANDGSPVTKRVILCEASQLFDPLGFLAPLSNAAKILLQHLWQQGVNWDEQVSPEIEARWEKWKKLRSEVKQLRIPRWYKSCSPMNNVQLHIFCDSSEEAFGAAAYLRVRDKQEIHVTLVASKGRVAPVKRVTIPRLELLAAVIGARLGQYIKSALSFRSLPIWFWTDSYTALQWIRSSSSRWKTFVANRVEEIQALSQPQDWRFCCGQDNPADILTRENSSHKIFSGNLWWHGPKWLLEPEENWNFEPSKEEKSKEPGLKAEQQKPKVITFNITTHVWNDLIDLDRISNYGKAVRMVAWVKRFIKTCKEKSRGYGVLTAEELHAAEGYWVRCVQMQHFPEEIQQLQQGRAVKTQSKIATFRPFLDSEGLVRVGSRLEQADLSEEVKFPILLPSEHRLAELFVQQEHRRIFHGGVSRTLAEIRHKFWLIKARRLVKRIINACLVCRKQRCAAASQRVGPLPADRIEEGLAFRTVGLDFAGPLLVRGEGKTEKKAYILLFTCASSRAIHLELTPDQSTEQFLLALRRFFARRGVSHTIYSDNAGTFHKANKELQGLYRRLTSSEVKEFCAGHQICWKYIVEKAAWWGGFWERMIQSVKRCLRKSLGRASLTFIELETVLTEVEATLNSRPLTYLSTDPLEEEPLTPAHLLIGTRLTTLPSGRMPTDPTEVSSKELNRRWKYRLRLSNQFWSRWKHEYLLALRTAHQLKDPPAGRSIQVGDLVLVNESRLPRHLWRTARVQSIKVGRDGLTRACELKTNLGQIIRRPIQLLYPLEVY